MSASSTDDAKRRCPTCGEAFPRSFSVCPHDATPLSDDEAPSKDRLIGAVLAATYRIVNVLGEGGMARLYEAEHLRVEKRYAVKVIHEELAKSPELLERFKREARAAARIRSPHIVTVIDVLQTPDGRPCMVTELLDGEDLQQRLDRLGKATARKAIPIARQICKALTAAHEGGVVHRDLKPSNVFLCREGGETLVKVLDFGVAKLDGNSELTKTGAIVGTLAYMAPEQAKRAADAGPLADIYQVGAVLYHMLTGEPPYGKDPPVNPLVLLLGGPPRAPRELEPSIPVGVEAVIQRAMARDPNERPASAADLDAQLAAFSRARSSDSERNSDDSDDGSSSERDDESSATIVPEREEARAIAREAARARPFALMLSGAAVAIAGFYASALLGALVSGEAGRTSGEQTLIILIAAGASGAIGVFLWRLLRARWRDLPSVQRLNRTLARSLGAGVLVFGALELLSLGLAAASEDYAGLASGWSFRLAIAGVAGLIGALWPQLRRTRLGARVYDALR